MRKYLIIFLLLLVMIIGVYLMETFNLISLKALGEDIIVNTPFLKEYVQTNEAFEEVSQQSNDLQVENRRLIGKNKELEKEIKSLTETVNQQNEQVEVMQKELASLRKTRLSEEKKIDKLVDIYSEMEAGDAAKIISTLDQDLALKILHNLKADKTAAILTNLTPEEAAELSAALE